VKLINKLLDGYNAYERPSEDDNSPLIVEFLVTLQQIMDVDEKNQVVHSNLWLTMVRGLMLNMEKTTLLLVHLFVLF